MQHCDFNVLLMFVFGARSLRIGMDIVVVGSQEVKGGRQLPQSTPEMETAGSSRTVSAHPIFEDAVEGDIHKKLSGDDADMEKFRKDFQDFHRQSNNFGMISKGFPRVSSASTKVLYDLDGRTTPIGTNARTFHNFMRVYTRSEDNRSHVFNIENVMRPMITPNGAKGRKGKARNKGIMQGKYPSMFRMLMANADGGLIPSPFGTPTFNTDWRIKSNMSFGNFLEEAWAKVTNSIKSKGNHSLANLHDPFDVRDYNCQHFLKDAMTVLENNSKLSDLYTRAFQSDTGFLMQDTSRFLLHLTHTTISKVARKGLWMFFAHCPPTCDLKRVIKNHTRGNIDWAYDSKIEGVEIYLEDATTYSKVLTRKSRRLAAGRRQYDHFKKLAVTQNHTETPSR